MILLNGFLVVNHFLKGEKFDSLHKLLVESAKKHGIDLIIKTNLELSVYNGTLPDFALFWDKDINLARNLEAKGLRLFNSSEAIEKCDNKAYTYTELFGKIEMPKTIIAPMSFFESDYSDFVCSASKELEFPVVFKDCRGSFGEQVYLCKTEEEIKSHISNRDFILQQFEAESSGKDVRIEVVGNKVVAAMKRENKNDFRSNLTNGGTAFPYTPTKEECATAIKCCSILGLDFGGVDILRNGKVCEVNSNAHIINIKNCTEIDCSDYIFEHIIKEL